MIALVAAGDVAETAARVLDAYPVARVASTAAARPVLVSGSIDVAVVDCNLDGAEDLVRTLRAGSLGDLLVPLVLLSDGPLPADLSPLAFDERVARTVRDDDLVAAVERAMRVSEYRHAVDDLYEECQRRARTGTTNPLWEEPSLRASRNRADELLGDLLGTPEVLTALLWTPGESDEE